ncbi:MAG: DUF3570 domain-containing protein [Magnetococcales bacterium]|nr:DUF3570 domain-containing protein [Magnetococcales bacterium]
MAVTDLKINGQSTAPGKGLAALMGAAMALPGLTSQAEAASQGEPAMAFSYLDYHEHGDLIDVRAPLVWGRMPIGEHYELEMTGALETMGGASPETVTNRTGETVQTLTGASIDDSRQSVDLKLTRFFEKGSLGIGGSFTSEDDYHGASVSIDNRWEFNQKNTVLALGVGYSSDDIDAVDGDPLNKKQIGWDFMVGVTQILSPTAIMQSNITYATGSGYFSDPYKWTFSFNPLSIDTDVRPNKHRQWAWLTRYNRHFPDLEGTLQSDYRFYWDNWGVTAHTMNLAWYQSIGDYWQLRPYLRYYDQNKADFYAETLPASPGEDGTISSDQRLGDFGAFSYGIKGIWEFDNGISLNALVERYQQDDDLAIGSGSPNFKTFDATFFILGAAYTF